MFEKSKDASILVRQPGILNNRYVAPLSIFTDFVMNTNKNSLEIIVHIIISLNNDLPDKHDDESLMMNK